MEEGNVSVCAGGNTAGQAAVRGRREMSRGLRSAWGRVRSGCWGQSGQGGDVHRRHRVAFWHPGAMLLSHLAPHHECWARAPAAAVLFLCYIKVQRNLPPPLVQGVLCQLISVSLERTEGPKVLRNCLVPWKWRVTREFPDLLRKSTTILKVCTEPYAAWRHLLLEARQQL